MKKKVLFNNFFILFLGTQREAISRIEKIEKIQSKSIYNQRLRY